MNKDRLGPAPKKARKLYFTDPFIHHAVRALLFPEAAEADPTRLLQDEAALAKEIEATLVTHLRRFAPTFYIKAKGEVDAAYIREQTFWPIEVKWTTRLRPKDLKQVSKYQNAVIAGRGRAQHDYAGVPVLPAPVVLLRIAGMGAGSGPGG